MKLKGLGVLLLAAGSLTQAAHASSISGTVSESLTGTISPGSYDYGGYFGFGSLGGDTVSFDLTYDTADTSFSGSSNYQEYYTSAPGLINLGVELGNDSFDLNTGNPYIQITPSTVNGAPGSQIFMNVSDAAGHFVWLTLYSTAPFAPNDLGNQAFLDTFASDIYVPTSGFLFGINGHADTLGFSTLAAVSSAETSATPEPAAGTLAGFGVVAVWLVRKRFAGRGSGV